MRRALALLATLVLTFASPRAARADLDEFLAKPEPAYRWEKKGEQTLEGTRVFDLHLVSQEWKGRAWEHRLLVFEPEKLDHPRFCTLFNAGGGGGPKDIEAGAKIAARSGTWVAFLLGNPNQPLWGKTEDALVVHTWLEFAKTWAADGKGDDSWPLHFPMAKAVIKGMDAVQAFVKESKEGEVSDFLVCGASKRGWTTWLVGASRDPRVKAIAPLVIDCLDVPVQAKHMIEHWGKPSEQVKDYTLGNIAALLETPAGKRLLELEDPWSYRERLTLPKLIVNGTNDRYWTQDALNLYWDDLRGEKRILYVPNSGHGLEDRDRVVASLAAFARVTAKGQKLPALAWTYRELPGGGVSLELTADAKIESARLWKASASTMDFRDSRWSEEPMKASEGKFEAEISKPGEGNQAVFGEATFDLGGAKFTLSTQIRILRSKKWY